MKKVVLLVLIFLLAGSSYALVKTRIYGEVDPNVNVKLAITYTANGMTYENQFVKVVSNNSGDWEYKIGSDAGTIEVQVTCLGEVKTFSVPAGPDFEVFLFDEEPAEETANETVDNETTTDSTEEVEEELAEEDSGGVVGLMGKAVSGEEGALKNSSLYFFLIVLFVTVIVANILSATIIGLFKKVRADRAERPIRVVKLSEKLKKAKGKLEKAREVEKQAEQELHQAKESEKEFPEVKASDSVPDIQAPDVKPEGE